MVVLKNTTNIAMNEYSEIRFFKGIFGGLLLVFPFWSIMIALFIWLCK